MAPNIPTILLTARSPLEAVKRVGSLLLYVARLNKTNKAIAARQTATISLVLWSNLGDIYLAMRNLVLPPGRGPYGPEARSGQSAVGGLVLPDEEASSVRSLGFAVSTLRCH